MNAGTKQPPPAFDVETLAIFLAVGANEHTKNRAELFVAWNKKEEGVQEAYRRRARRLMRTWKK